MKKKNPGKNTVEPAKMNQKLIAFLEEYIPQIKKLAKKASVTAWVAYTEGKDESYKQMEEAELGCRKFHTDAKKFKKIKEIAESGIITDPLLKRQLILTYNAYLENQIPSELMEKMVKLSTEIQKTFNSFRGEVDGKQYGRNDVIQILKESADNNLRKKVWEAHKEVGALVAPDLIKLVKLRNESARILGYKNFREMQLALQEHEPKMLDVIFSELDEKTCEPYKKNKDELNKNLAKRLNIPSEELRPWHYADPFMQEAPKSTEIDFDRYYKDKNLAEIARSYYKSFGLDPDAILKRSDLFPRQGKCEHAFCFPIDREGDIRVLCNITPSSRWMNIILHELGHGLYESYYEKSMPWLLRQPAHIFTTEGIAELFGEITINPYWLKEIMGLTENESIKLKSPILKQKTFAKLMFARWSLVMYNFEKALYENPEQDLTTLWWDIVEKYQMVKRPDNRVKPDWATKDHFVCAPVYYHNYALGQMFACQLLERIASISGENDPLKVIFKDRPELGKYLIEKVFKPGASLHWTEFVEFSSGKPLGVDSYIKSLNWGKE